VFAVLINYVIAHKKLKFN